MTINEIIFIFFLPIVLFLLVQFIILFKFRDLAKEMLLGRQIMYLLCKYDDCTTGSPTCFTNNGLRIITLQNNVEMPSMCHSNINILKDIQGLNPFRRITEDYVVMFLSISLMMIFLHMFGINIISYDRIWDLFILILGSIFLTIFILVLSHEELSLASTILGLNTIFALFIYYALYIYNITWQSFPYIDKNIISNILYKIFSHYTIMQASAIVIASPVILLFILWKVYRYTQV